MKIFAFILLFCSFGSISSEVFSQKLLKKVTDREWVHYHEGDTPPNRKAYKPADFDFPPSRGRDRFKIFSDGTAMLTFIGPNDAPVERKGIWNKQRDKNKIVIHLEATDYAKVATYMMEFYKLQDDTLLLMYLKMD